MYIFQITATTHSSHQLEGFYIVIRLVGKKERGVTDSLRVSSLNKQPDEIILCAKTAKIKSLPKLFIRSYLRNVYREISCALLYIAYCYSFEAVSHRNIFSWRVYLVNRIRTQGWVQSNLDASCSYMRYKNLFIKPSCKKKKGQFLGQTSS